MSRTFNFLSSKAETLFTKETCSPTYLFSDWVLGLLQQHLNDLTDPQNMGGPVALWIKHRKRGDTFGSSTSHLHGVLFRQDDRLIKKDMQDLPLSTRTRILEVLGAFFLEKDLCEDLYGRAGFCIMRPMETVHFRNLTLLCGHPEDCDGKEFDDHVQELGFCGNILGLKASMHPNSDTSSFAALQAEAESSFELIHNSQID